MKRFGIWKRDLLKMPEKREMSGLYPFGTGGEVRME